MGQSHGVETTSELSEADMTTLTRITRANKDEIRQMYSEFLTAFPKGHIDRKTFAKTFANMYPTVNNSFYSVEIWLMFSNEMEFDNISNVCWFAETV